MVEKTLKNVGNNLTTKNSNETKELYWIIEHE